MATFTAVKNKKQTASAMVNVMEYVTQAAKIMLVATHIDTEHLHNHLVVNSVSCVDGRESFIEFMENEGYQVTWADNRKHITFTCPNGRKCRDSSLHDETFLKENLEALFRYRQAMGFRPRIQEPDMGWMGELASGIIQLGGSLENSTDLPPLPIPPTWTDSKQRRREALKKLAMGQKLSGDQNQSWQPMM